MLRRDYFVAAMKAGLYKQLSWIISAFAISQDEGWQTDPYLYRIYHNASGHYYVGPEGKLVAFEDAPDASEPLFKFKNDFLDITSEDIPNVREPLTTTYGNFLFNYLVMVYAFGGKLPYQTGPVAADKIEAQILKKFDDDPAPGAPHLPDVVYVSEYLRYTEAMYFLTGLTQLCVVASSKKTLTPPPGIREYREKLLKENEGHLTELTTIAKIDAQLVAYDAAWLKGDIAESAIAGTKARAVIRKKKFLMHGAEEGLDENAVHGVLITNSLDDGWDVSKFADMNNSLRSGSFDRGAQTMLGGVSVKWLLRASANTAVTADDCGSKMGSPTLITASNKSKYVGFTAIDAQQQQVKLADEEVAGRYLGQTVLVRNPMYCRLPYTDYCKVCVGDRLAVNPTGLSVAVSDYGNSFLTIFLKKMHGKQLRLARLNLVETIV